jgi:hypothetical protein
MLAPAKPGNDHGRTGNEGEGPDNPYPLIDSSVTARNPSPPSL